VGILQKPCAAGFPEVAAFLGVEADLQGAALKSFSI
jgi:hypothetical protein